jgi:hypothetical protein
MIKLEELKNMAAALTEIRRVEEKKMDKVNKDAVKGDFDDREDKDIDNDGDVDASDRYLHNRRKAVTKAVAKDTEESKDYGPGHIGAIQKMLDKERETKKSKSSVKKESTELEEKVYSSDYNVGYERSQFGGYRPSVTHKKTGKTMYLGQTSYKKPEHAKGHAAAYLKGYEQMGDTTANRYANEYEKANKQHVYKESTELDEAKKSDYHKLMLKALGKSRLPKDHNFTSSIANNGDFVVHDGGGRVVGRIEKGEYNLDEAKNAADHRQGLIDKIKKSGVVKSGSMSKKEDNEIDELSLSLKDLQKTGLNKAASKNKKDIEKDLKSMRDRLKNVDEKAESEAQAIAARIALKHKREGTKPEPGSASAEMMKMSEKDLEDFTKMKKGAPYKVNEAGRRRDYVPRGKKGHGDIEVDGQLVLYGQESWGQWTVTSPKRLTHIKANSKSDLIKMIKDELKESTVLDEDAWEEIPMMKRQLQFIKYAAEEIMGYMDMTMDPEEWFQNKLAHVHDQMQSLHAYIEGDKRMMAMEATDAEIRAKQTAGATEPEGIADKESEGSKNFMLRHTTEIPSEANIDKVIKANAEEIKASLQRKVSHRWNDQKTGDK